MPARSPVIRIVASLASVVMIGSLAVACGDDDEATSTTAADASSETTESEAADGLSISDAWVRPAEDLAASTTSAIYMVIEGGAQDDALVSASVPADITDTVEIHETTTADGDDMGSDTTMGGDDMGSDTTMGGDDTGDMGGGAMMQMQEVDSVEIPAGGTVMLEPGGFHIMLLDLKRELTIGETVEVTLTFETAGEQTVTAQVREA